MTDAAYEALEDLGRVRLSRNFFMRDFLYSETANHFALRNVPEDPDLAIEVGRHLCEELLEPLQATFGRVHIRSAFRSESVNAFCGAQGLNCAPNDRARGAKSSMCTGSRVQGSPQRTPRGSSTATSSPTTCWSKR